MRYFIFIFAGALLFSCANETDDIQPGCSTPATVVDLRGLDGCGFVFELEDGRRIEPLFLFWCGTPPLPEEAQNNPLADFEFAAGKKVMIDFEVDSLYSSTCMAGEMARITCLTEVEVTQTDY